MNWIKSLQKTTIQTKLVVPIIIAALLSMYLSTKVIGSTLYQQIFTAQEEEIKSFSNKIFYILRSDYRTLFFEFGKDEFYYNQASDAAQAESINNLTQMFIDAPYNIYIVDGNKNVIPISQNCDFDKILTHDGYLHDITPLKRMTLINDRFVYKVAFTPWDWEIVVIRDTELFENIILENQKLIFMTIFLLMFAIIAILFIVIKIVIQNPFAKVFEYLNDIAYDRVTTPLQSDETKETQLLSKHINSMNSAIINRQEEIERQRARNQMILNSQTSIVVVSTGEKIASANDSFFEFFNEYKDVNEFLQEHECICDFFEKVDKKGFIYKDEEINWIEKIIQSDTTSKVMIKRGEKNYTFAINAKHIGTSTTEYVVNLTDITQIENYKEQLELSREQLNTQLHTDELTKLPNRLSLSEKMLNQNVVSLILININDFKEVNDFYGTQTGDKILYDFGQALLELTKGKHYDVYKLSGDEFALYTIHHYPRESVATFANKILDELKAHHFYDLSGKRKINLTATAGAAINHENSTSFVSADIAIKTAKKKKRPFMTYKESQATKDEYASNIEWASKLKAAFKEDKVIPYYQPILNNKTNKIEKYEALVRLIDDDGKVIPPFFFLDVAKKSHQYLELTERMIDKTFAYFKDKNCDFSINLSESDLADFSINTLIIEKLQSCEIGPRVTFEIVESENIDDYQMVSEFIQEVKKYGAKIAIDDFGAGFSNFQHVSQLNVDYLKIDGSLIQNILIDKNSETIVEAIATFAKRLEIKTIAEFVDSQEIHQKVIDMGIDYTQGYYISEPKPTIECQA